ncbi:hypothetical protein CRENBAI_000542 [Crenichthys baileyi]|uniref:Uncharacterized protein n=1 Tax=Crenichthys baileyi TaxID=28760 RepID=A0AAV9R8C4_9TELE
MPSVSMCLQRRVWLAFGSRPWYLNCHLVMSEEPNTLRSKSKMAANTMDHTGGSSIHKHQPQHFSVQRALELLGLIDGDNSDLDLSDNDDPILVKNYQPSPQEQSSSEEEGDSSEDEDPIPEPTHHSRGQKCLRCVDNG